MYLPNPNRHLLKFETQTKMYSIRKHVLRIVLRRSAEALSENNGKKRIEFM